MTDALPIESLYYSDNGPHIISATRAIAARGAHLHALLQSGISGLTGLGSEPFSPPVPIAEDALPIGDFLYRGRAALDRAIEVRNGVRARNGAPSTDEIEELFALLDLAAAE